MKKWTICLLLIFCLSLGLSTTANAASFSGNVTFNGKTVSSTITEAAVADAIGAMLPGDTLTITAHLKNNYSKPTEWWMSNEVIETFEQNKGADSGYTYKLVYKPKSGSSVTLYDNSKVGGEDKTGDRQGLAQATKALEDYFYLDKLAASSGTGTVTLTVSLDGETMRNDYQGSKAKLGLAFAVEIVNTRTIVRTGDETVILPYLAAALVSGLALLTVAVVRLNKHNRKQRGGQSE
ncbi:MAG: hypothetical protein IKQ10_06755 [Oscillospiraceae bacterium]|nr:hypothetical protein [Oscillospiraceae bacterium]